MNALVIRMATHDGEIAQLALRDYFAAVLLLAGIAFIAVAAVMVARAPDVAQLD